MTRPRATLRLRLALLFAGLVVTCTSLLLAASWLLLDGHLARTLPPGYAEEVMARLAGQYVLAVIGAALLALGLGWAVAGHALRPLRAIIASARRVSQSRLDERIELQGPDDELRELADTLDAMLDRLQAAVEAQRRFVANASHELRTPLTVIRTQADVALADPHADAAELRAMGEVVLETADRIDALLDNLLVLARGERGGLPTTPVDLGAIVREAVCAVQPEADAASVKVTLAGEPAHPAVVAGEPVLLRRLVGNLLENAVRHNVEGGRVEVELRSSGEEAVLSVVNGGPRIPPEAIARLAEPFQRLDRVADRGGSGLGLSIVKAVSAAHGGRLELAARPAGGLRAQVRLPLLSAERGQQRPAGEQALITN